MQDGLFPRMTFYSEKPQLFFLLENTGYCLVVSGLQSLRPLNKPSLTSSQSLLMSSTLGGHISHNCVEYFYYT